ncbi:hypothetical protein GCM10010448_37170 [Streptomyces glomeratus]|uniref:Uncharacterized protein n=1 Tax=Streptomyces glomeratus TaxID=284452 RepID=A0ABP6LLM4_9ACTN
MVRVTRIRDSPFAAAAKAGTTPAQRDRSGNVITLNPTPARHHCTTRQGRQTVLPPGVSRLKSNPVGPAPISTPINLRPPDAGTGRTSAGIDPPKFPAR